MLLPIRSQNDHSVFFLKFLTCSSWSCNLFSSFRHIFSLFLSIFHIPTSFNCFHVFNAFILPLNSLQQKKKIRIFVASFPHEITTSSTSPFRGLAWHSCCRSLSIAFSFSRFPRWPLVALPFFPQIKRSINWSDRSSAIGWPNRNSTSCASWLRSVGFV